METQGAIGMEELQSLGFDGEHDYADHQSWLARCAEIARSQTLIEAEGHWCVLPRCIPR